MTAVSPELGRADDKMRGRILPELVNYKNRLVPFMPGRSTSDKERNFFVIFSAMIGAVELARMPPEPVAKRKVLANSAEFLLRSF